MDSRLHGVWRMYDESGAVHFLHIGRGPDNLMRIVFIEHKPSGSIDMLQLAGFPTEIRGQRYMNLLAPDPPDERVQYTFCRYDLPKADQLAIYLVDQSLMATAVTDNTLRGTVSAQGAVRLEDTSERLAAFIANAPSEELFPHLVQFQRIGP